MKEDDLLTVTQVALLFRVDPTTVRRWIKDGILEAVILPHSGKRQVACVKRETVDGLLGISQEGEET